LLHRSGDLPLRDPRRTVIPCNGDADCSDGSRDGCARIGVRLEPRATLDLAGYELSGGVVHCPGKGSCTVRNGEITGGRIGVLAAHGRVDATDLLVHDA